ncbi:MAG: EAL domain-containing protein, partial [Thiomonas sp.]
LHPETTRAQIEAAAQVLGMVHALVGAGSPLMMQTIALYRGLLNTHLNRTLMPPRERYRLLQATDLRLQDDLQAQLQAAELTVQEYLSVLATPLPQLGTPWTDAEAVNIQALGRLPGMQGALLMRLNLQGVFNVENRAGPRGADIAALLQTPGAEAVVDPNSPRGQGLSAQAWRTLGILRSPSYAKDPRYAAWREPARRLGIRSTLSVPIRNELGQAVAVLSLFGAYPNQFESSVMQQFARSLQQRWEQIWLRSATPAPVVPLEHALDMRQRLFDGGLRMFMQPIINLETGRPCKVEALARLEQPSGEIVAPALFLPLLGDVELNRLFRMGLDIGLEQIRVWDSEGLTLDLSVNLPPRSLLDPDCATWVAAALSRHAVPPRRLTLELLESQLIDQGPRDEAMARLVNLGVKLAMDDLGSGYSSLERLSALPFDTIKIDQGLLVRLRKTPLKTISLIGAIIQMGRDFERDVVVEGLEDLGLIEVATILGADFGQGYAFARPMPADRIPQWESHFKNTVQHGVIQTFAGALAYHWRHNHGGFPGAENSADQCPVTAFLAAQGISDVETSAWHRQTHAEPDNTEANRRFLDWLAERVSERT